MNSSKIPAILDQQIRLAYLSNMGQKALVKVVGHLSTSKHFVHGGKSIITSQDVNRAVPEILSCLQPSELKDLNQSQYRDKIFSSSGYIKQYIDITNFDISLLTVILQLNISIYPTRSAKCRRQDAKLKCRGLNHSKQCCSQCDHQNSDKCSNKACNTSKSSCDNDNTVCCNICNECSNCSQLPLCINSGLRDCVKGLYMLRNLIINATNTNLYNQLQFGSFTHTDFGSNTGWQQFLAKSCHMIIKILQYLFNVKAIDKNTLDTESYEINKDISTYKLDDLWKLSGPTIVEILKENSYQVPYVLRFALSHLKVYSWLSYIGLGSVIELSPDDSLYYSPLSKEVRKNVRTFFKQHLESNYGAYFKIEFHDPEYKEVRAKEDRLNYRVVMQPLDSNLPECYKNRDTRESEELWGKLETHLQTAIKCSMGMDVKIGCDGWTPGSINITVSFTKVKKEKWLESEACELDDAVGTSLKSFTFSKFEVASKNKITDDGNTVDAETISFPFIIYCSDENLKQAIEDLLPDLRTSALQLKLDAGKNVYLKYVSKV